MKVWVVKSAIYIQYLLPICCEIHRKAKNKTSSEQNQWRRTALLNIQQQVSQRMLLMGLQGLSFLTGELG